MAFTRTNGAKPLAFGRPLALSITAGFLLFGVVASYLNAAAFIMAISHLAMILACVLIVTLASEGDGGIIGRLLCWRPVVYLGSISYGFYLFHNFAPTIVNRLIRVGALPNGSDVGLIAPVLNFSITLAIAALSWVILERPINRLKARFPYVSVPLRADIKANAVTIDLDSNRS